MGRKGNHHSGSLPPKIKPWITVLSLQHTLPFNFPFATPLNSLFQFTWDVGVLQDTNSLLMCFSPEVGEWLRLLPASWWLHTPYLLALTELWCGLMLPRLFHLDMSRNLKHRVLKCPVTRLHSRRLLWLYFQYWMLLPFVLFQPETWPWSHVFPSLRLLLSPFLNGGQVLPMFFLHLHWYCLAPASSLILLKFTLQVTNRVIDLNYRSSDT